MNRFKRMLFSTILMLTNSSSRRIALIKKHHLYGSIGDNCSIQKRKLPLYSNLVFLHNNVHVASNVGFVTHDIIHRMLNIKYLGGGLCGAGRLHRNHGQCVCWFRNKNTI